ncbi:hypothetical protein ACLVWQ_14870 [Streptomyces sp. CWNU-52B]|uniref:hypothetical protein n=1 Tax=unclassified Streptomyces TaxID=2593676 RepID=UPI0039C23291
MPKESKGKEMRNVVGAQFEFMETMLSLDQMLRAGSHHGVKSHDIERRANIIFEALGRATGKEVIETWKEEWLKDADEARKIVDPVERKEAIEKNDLKRADDLSRLIDSIPNGGRGSLQMALHQISSRPRPEELIYRAILVTSVSAFEGLVTACYRAILESKPDGVISGNKEFSLADLVSFNSIEDAVADSIERRVDAALRGSIEDWATTFQKFDVQFQNLGLDWPNIVEVFMRRNAYIHTQGKVNSTYVSKVKGSPAKGALLMLDEAYLKEALSSVMALGMLISARTFIHLNPKHEVAAAGMSFLYINELMDLGYWRCVKEVCANLKAMNSRLDMKFDLRFSYWLACKRLSGLESIRKEVESLDVSALKTEYSFMKAVLLEDEKTAKVELEVGLARSESWVNSSEIDSFLKHQEGAQWAFAERSRILGNN